MDENKMTTPYQQFADRALCEKLMKLGCRPIQNIYGEIWMQFPYESEPVLGLSMGTWQESYPPWFIFQESDFVTGHPQAIENCKCVWGTEYWERMKMSMIRTYDIESWDDFISECLKIQERETMVRHAHHEMRKGD